MKLVKEFSANQSSKIEQQLANFKTTFSPSRQNRYPKFLKMLVREAVAYGYQIRRLRELTGVSRSVLHQWSKCLVKERKVNIRQLKVVGKPATDAAPAIIRFPSGIAVEFSRSSDLTSEIMGFLGAVGVSHASHC